MIRKWTLISVVATVGFVVSFYSAWSLYDLDEKAIYSDFTRDVDGRAASFYRGLTINLEALYSLSVLYSGSEIPSRNLFSIEATKILQRHKEIQALEWIPRVLESQRALYENELQQTFPAAEILEREHQGLMVRAGEREEYFPVHYVEPLLGNETALGFDLASNSTRLETLLASGGEGLPLATASIQLVQGGRNKNSFLAFLPQYLGEALTIEERQEKLYGFVLGVFRIGDIFYNTVINDTAPLGIEVIVVDDTPGPEQGSIVHVHKPRLTTTEFDEYLSYKKALPEIWGRQWSMIARPTSDYVSQRRNSTSIIVFSVGIFLTIIMCIYIFQMYRRTAIIQQLVENRTKELKQTNKILVDTQNTLQIEQKRTKQSLQTRTEELKGAQLQLMHAEKMEAIGTLAAGVAHEVKNPLAIIQLGIDYIKKIKNVEEIKEISGELEESIIRADSVIKELLDFSATKNLELKDIELNPVVDNVLSLVNHLLITKTIQVNVNYGDDLAKIKIDQSKIQQVLINLITNAVNAMGEKGELSINTYSLAVDKLPAEYGLSFVEKQMLGKTSVIIEIIDDGVGIEEDKLKKIFDPFYTTKQAGTSIGLGLSVTQNIARLHNAVIKIHNNNDKGVTAFVIFAVAGG